MSYRQPTRRQIFLAMSAIPLASISAGAHSQSKQAAIIVPVPPGGTMDLIEGSDVDVALGRNGQPRGPAETTGKDRPLALGGKAHHGARRPVRHVEMAIAS